MKLFEVDAELSKKINFDLPEDAIVYMRNEPMFYRKEYYPTMTHMAEQHRAGKQFDYRQALMPMINKAIEGYTAKYKLAPMTDDIFTEEHRQKICDKLYKEEMEQIRKGEYQ